MSRKPVVGVLLLLALACEKHGETTAAPPEASPLGGGAAMSSIPRVPEGMGGSGSSDAGAVVAAVTPEPAAPVDLRTQLMRRGLRIVRLDPLPPIGREGCADISRVRVSLINGAHADLSKFGSPRDMMMCFGAYHQALLADWQTVGQNLFARALWIAETSPDVDPRERELIRRLLPTLN